MQKLPAAIDRLSLHKDKISIGSIGLQFQGNDLKSININHRFSCFRVLSVLMSSGGRLGMGPLYQPVQHQRL